MRTLAIALTFWILAPLAAPDKEGIAFWTAGELKSYERRLGPKMSPAKVAAEQLGKYGNHTVMIIHREGDGESELHENQNDVFVVQSGEGTLIVGGDMVGGHSTAPGEVRGTSISGGVRRRLGPGDMVHIPPKTAHQVLVPAGRQITYVVVKVDAAVP